MASPPAPDARRRALGAAELARLLLAVEGPAALVEGGRVAAANRKFADLLGQAPDALEGTGFLSLVAPSSRAPATEGLHGATGPFELELLGNEGHRVQVMARSETVDAGGRPLQRIRLTPLPAGSDLAALRLAEIEKLREMSQFKTRILNMAAHELNTPLTPLRLQTHLLLSGSLGGLEARQRHAVEIVDRNVSRLAKLVQEILDVARLQGGRLKVVMAPVDAAGAVNEAVDSFAETARRLSIDLATQTEPGLAVQADRGRLLQILFNLLSNALKFTPEGGQVRLAATTEGGFALVEVRDSGSGMTAEQISRLFQPFSQVHDTAAITVPGTGLGLYICRGLAEAMGGRIEAASGGPGHGSTFQLRLPLATERPATPAPVPPAPVRQPGPQEALARRLRELI